MERAGRGMSGSIKNPTFCIWIQLNMTRRKSGGRATVRVGRRKKEEGKRKKE